MANSAISTNLMPITMGTSFLDNTSSKTKSLKSWEDIPRLSSLPFLGQTHHFLPGGTYYNCDGIKLWEKLHEQYGPITVLKTLFIPTTVLVFDPDCAEQILRGENRMPIRPGLDLTDYHNKSSTPLKPAGLLNEQGERWKNMRSKVGPLMLRSKTINLYKDVIEEVAVDMIQRLKSLRDENGKFSRNFMDEMSLWALESIGVVALGQRLNCFKLHAQEDSRIKELIDCTHKLNHFWYALYVMPSIWKNSSTETFKRDMGTYGNLESIIQYFVDKRIKELRSEDIKRSDDKESVLEKLIHLDEDIARVMAADMLLAGIDTTANSVTGLLYLLATNMSKQNELRRTLQTEDKKYLKACIKEAMRMMPVVGLNKRQTTRRYNLLGYDIPEGVTVIFCHEHMSKSEKYYTRPDEFLPERWLVTPEDPLYHGNSHPVAFSPFGYGSRRHIAALELETLLIKIIENFQIEWTGPPPNITYTTINYITGPFHFVFKDI